jgi:hypothetical protein
MASVAPSPRCWQQSQFRVATPAFLPGPFRRKSWSSSRPHAPHEATTRGFNTSSVGHDDGARRGPLVV